MIPPFSQLQLLTTEQLDPMFKSLMKRTEFQHMSAYAHARANIFNPEYGYAIAQPGKDIFYLLKKLKKNVSAVLDTVEPPPGGVKWNDMEFNYIRERLHAYFGPVDRRYGKDPALHGFTAPAGYSVALFRLMLHLILHGEDRP